MAVSHAMVAADGQLNETEVLATIGSALSEVALKRLQTGPARGVFADSQQPGASPQSHEGFFTFEFAPIQPRSF